MASRSVKTNRVNHVLSSANAASMSSHSNSAFSPFHPRRSVHDKTLCSSARSASRSARSSRIVFSAVVSDWASSVMFGSLMIFSSWLLGCGLSRTRPSLGVPRSQSGLLGCRWSIAEVVRVWESATGVLV